MSAAHEDRWRISGSELLRLAQRLRYAATLFEDNGECAAALVGVACILEDKQADMMRQSGASAYGPQARHASREARDKVLSALRAYGKWASPLTIASALDMKRERVVGILNVLHRDKEIERRGTRYRGEYRAPSDNGG